MKSGRCGIAAQISLMDYGLAYLRVVIVGTIAAGCTVDPLQQADPKEDAFPDRVAWSLAAGQRIRIEIEVTIKEEFKFPLRRSAQEVEWTLAVQGMWVVRAIDSENVARIDALIDKVTCKLDTLVRFADTPEQNRSVESKFDSTTQERVPGLGGRTINLILEALAKTGYSFALDVRGRVMDVRLSKEIIDGLRKNRRNPEGISTFGSHEELEDVLCRFLPEFAIGKSSWSMTRRFACSDGSAGVKQQFTYKGEERLNERSFAVVSIESEALSNREQEQIAVKPGHIYFDTEKGRLHEFVERRAFSPKPEDKHVSAKTLWELRLILEDAKP